MVKQLWLKETSIDSQEEEGVCHLKELFGHLLKQLMLLFFLEGNSPNTSGLILWENLDKRKTLRKFPSDLWFWLKENKESWV